MSSDAPEPPPPSPSTPRQRYAPTAARLPSRDASTQNEHFGSPFSSLAVHIAHLPNSTVNAFCGASAGIASGIVTCPLDVIKTRLQAQGSFRPRNLARPTRAVYNGLVGTARVIWLEDGVRGMYRGLGPMLLGYIPTWAVYMTVYDFSKDFFSARMGLCVSCTALIRQLTVIARKQMAISDIRLNHGRRMLDASHQPNMGDQNETDVPSERPCIGRK